MTIEQESFALNLANAAKNHEEWLSIIRFGLGTLIERPFFLAELIAQEAGREADRHNQDRVTALQSGSDHIASILVKLNLKLTRGIQIPQPQ